MERDPLGRLVQLGLELVKINEQIDSLGILKQRFSVGSEIGRTYDEKLAQLVALKNQLEREIAETGQSFEEKNAMLLIESKRYTDQKTAEQLHRVATSSVDYEQLREIERKMSERFETMTKRLVSLEKDLSVKDREIEKLKRQVQQQQSTIATLSAKKPSNGNGGTALDPRLQGMFDQFKQQTEKTMENHELCINQLALRVDRCLSYVSGSQDMDRDLIEECVAAKVGNLKLSLLSIIRSASSA